MDIMQQPACLVWTQSRFIAMVSFWLCDGGSGLRLNDGPVCWLVPDVCLWLGPQWLNLGFFFLALTICESWAIFFVSS